MHWMDRSTVVHVFLLPWELRPGGQVVGRGEGVRRRAGKYLL